MLHRNMYGDYIFMDTLCFEFIQPGILRTQIVQYMFLFQELCVILPIITDVS